MKNLTKVYTTLFHLIIITMVMFGAYAKADLPVRLTQTYYLQHSYSKSYLIQGYTGKRDDKRNTEAQPMGAPNDDNYRWILVAGPRVDRKRYHYLVNLKTGLALTQDAVGDNNVSNWGVERRKPELDNRQLWHVRVVGRDLQSGQNVWRLTNKATGRALTQHSFGAKPEEANVTVWDARKYPLHDRGFQWIAKDAGKMDLCKLKIKSIKCIKASTGKDSGTKFLFAAIEFSAGLATGGSTAGLSAGSQAAKEAIKHAVKAGLKAGFKEGGKMVMSKAGQVMTKKVITNMVAQKAASTAIKKGSLAAANEIGDESADSFVELAFDKIYGKSPDQLEIKINGVSIWPNGGRDWRNIKSQQTLPVNIEYIFPRKKMAAIQLKEYDSGSGDDSLGWLELDTSGVYRPEHYEDVIIRRKSEGSLYQITLSVEPLEWRPERDALPRSVQGAKLMTGKKIGVGILPVNAMFPWGQSFVMVINGDGSVSRHGWRGNKMGRERKLPGSKIDLDPLTCKAIFALGHIMVVDQYGNVKTHRMDNITGEIGKAKPLTGHKIAPDYDAKAIFPMANQGIIQWHLVKRL